MCPFHPLRRLSLILCALRLTSSPDRCQNRGERQGELAGQRRAPRRACPAPQPPPEFREGARIARPGSAPPASQQAAKVTYTEAVETIVTTPAPSCKPKPKP